MKRFLSLLLSLALLMALAVPAFGATTSEIQSANTLYTMGLLKGVGTNSDGTPVFALDESLTRAQGVTLLLRLLGKESEVAGTWKTPFQDISGNWAEAAIGYAYTMGYTNGVSSTRFGGDDTLTRQQFVTLVLRALGYQESNGDFTYTNAESFAQSLGLLTSAASTTSFTRGDAAEICCAALKLNYRSTSSPLIRRLVSSGAVTSTQAQSAGYASYLSDGTGAAIGSELSASQVYSACSPAVFYLVVYDASGSPLQTGSGFFLSADGTAATNYHVIDGGSSATVTLADGSSYAVSGVYDYDADRDIALLKVNGSGFSYLTEGNSDSIVGGSTVYAIGSPLGLENTISQGIISNTNRTLEGYSYIQTSASISSGSSGGALIDTSGHVIGITSGTFSEGQNLNLAVPINAVNQLTKTTLTPLASLVQSSAASADFSLSLSQSSVTIAAGSYTTINLSYTGSDDVTFSGSISKPSVCYARWINTNSSTPGLLITGLTPGSAVITLNVTDSSGNLLTTKTIAVTVTNR